MTLSADAQKQDKINKAMQWLSEQPEQYPDSLSTQKLLIALTTGVYNFTKTRMLTTKPETQLSVSAALNACLLKTLALLLEARLYGNHKIIKPPYNWPGQGGADKAVRVVHNLISQERGYQFVFKTGIANYYASIDHEIVYLQIRKLWKKPPAWVNLICQAMKAEINSHIGIINGSPLSYVLGSYYLSQLEQAFMHKESIRCVRHMDDIIILTKTRSSLHRAISTCRGIIAALQLTLSYEQTYVGKTNKEFNFLGHRFNGEPATVEFKQSSERAHPK